MLTLPQQRRERAEEGAVLTLATTDEESPVTEEVRGVVLATSKYSWLRVFATASCEHHS
jgi:hypothetical protein